MTFTPYVIPDPSQAVLDDSQGQFDADTPWDVKQTAITMRRHRWFQVVDIGNSAGPYAITPGLVAGTSQRIQFDNKPDFIIVTCSGDTAATGRLSLFLGELGGPPIRIGPSGRAIVPGPHDGIISLTSRGTTPAYGTVIGCAGYDISIDLYAGL
jgi:hypothetical protein